MPAQASPENITAAQTLSHKLTCADGIVAALLNTFDEQSDEPLMPGAKMQAALLALGDLIADARQVVQAG